MINTKNETYSLCKKIPIVLPFKSAQEIDAQINIPQSYYKFQKEILTSTITNAEFFKNVANITSLTLEHTQHCNLFCKYCAYSGIYKSRRIHKNMNMSLDIAKKSVDLFFKQLKSPRRFIRKTPVISFYGGEPLLEYERLMEIVKYGRSLSNENDIEVKFLITSNGVLFTKEKINFMVKENIGVDISLDGPETEHNRFRLKTSGEGSFKDVYNNIKYIRMNYPDYFEKNIRFKITLHPFHDIFAIEEFFLSNNELFSEKNVSINQVVVNDDLGIDVMHKLNTERKNQIEAFYNAGNSASWFFNKFFFESLQVRLESKGTPIISEIASFTGTCFPGVQKFFVNIYGKILVCERGMEDFPIGNVYDGININAIERIVYKWRNDILDRECWNCGYWYICSMCFASNKKGKNFSITKSDCERVKEISERMLKRYIEQMEEKDAIYENDYSNVTDFLDSLHPIKI